MLGILIGLVFGAAALTLLIRFVRSLTNHKNIAVWMLIVQPLCMMIGLGLTAWLAPGDLLGTGIAMASILTGGAIVYALKTGKERKRNDSGGDKTAERTGLE